MKFINRVFYPWLNSALLRLRLRFVKLNLVDLKFARVEGAGLVFDGIFKGFGQNENLI